MGPNTPRGNILATSIHRAARSARVDANETRADFSLTPPLCRPLSVARDTAAAAILTSADRADGLVLKM
jgi:hypothetical protein